MFEGKLFIMESIYIAIKLKLLAMMVLNITLMFRNILTKTIARQQLFKIKLYLNFKLGKELICH